MNKLFIALIGILLFTGCKKELTTTPKADGKFKIETFDFNYLSSRAKFKYQNGKQKLSTTANFRLKKDSVIWISISKLGIEGARVMATREGVQMIDKLSRSYYVFDYAQLSEMYGIEISFDLAQALAVGNVLFEPKRRRHVVDDGRFFSYSKEEGPFGINQFIGKSSKRLERLMAYQSNSNNSIVVNYGDFEDVGDQRAAQKIRARIKMEDETKEDVDIDLEYSRMELLDDPLNFPFNVSSKYVRK